MTLRLLDDLEGRVMCTDQSYVFRSYLFGMIVGYSCGHLVSRGPGEAVDGWWSLWVDSPSVIVTIGYLLVVIRTNSVFWAGFSLVFGLGGVSVHYPGAVAGSYVWFSLMETKFGHTDEGVSTPKEFFLPES
jgi:hypothetical protein